MQKLAEICIRRPVFATMIVLSLVVVGTAGFFRLGVDRFPSVDLPTVSIRVGLPGAAPEEAPKLGFDRLSSPLRLFLEGTERGELAALGQHGLDTWRAECSDQLTFEVGIADVEAEVLEVVR